jgi:hypothetical protein
MKAQIVELLTKLQTNSIPFKDVIAFIERVYQHTPTAFKNGDTYNEASENQGSAKVFAFAIINNLSKEDTLLLFAEHYQAVRENLEGTDHQNIRQFLANGFEGIQFEGVALTAK